MIRDMGSFYQGKTNCMQWQDGPHSTVIGAMRDLGSLIKKAPIALSGWMVCTAEALVLCGMWALSSRKHQWR